MDYEILIESFLNYIKIKNGKYYDIKTYMISGSVPFSIIEFFNPNTRDIYIQSLMDIKIFPFNDIFSERLIEVIYRYFEFIGRDIGYDQYDSSMIKTLQYQMISKMKNIDTTELDEILTIIKEDTPMSEKVMTLKLIL